MAGEDIGAVEDFEAGSPRIVTFQGRQVAVVRWGDEIFALRNVCPHQTESFAHAKVHGAVECGDEVGELRMTDRVVLSCPRHTWTFDLNDGHCTVDPTVRVRTFLTTVEDGRVLLHDAPRITKVASG